MGHINKKNISVNAGKCVGCMDCQMICSLTFNFKSDPDKARIVIEDKDGGREIYFTDECLEDCYLCTNCCPYGAIVHKEPEVTTERTWA